jgi:hypothetical protein
MSQRASGRAPEAANVVPERLNPPDVCKSLSQVGLKLRKQSRRLLAGENGGKGVMVSAGLCEQLPHNLSSMKEICSSTHRIKVTFADALRVFTNKFITTTFCFYTSSSSCKCLNV